jgi:glycosyltransferase involved in cell wall biosynthesis
VEDYCNFLGQALARRGVQLKPVRVEWVEEGWARALWKLRRESAEWRGAWVLLQYTALGWSRRGFPFGALLALAILHWRGRRCAVVFHEPVAPERPRWIDKIRGACQDWVIRALHARAERSIFTSPLDKIGWLPAGDSRAAFIPIGANIPEHSLNGSRPHMPSGNRRTVAVFCLSDAPNRSREIGDIAHSIRSLAMNGTELQLVFLGKGTAEANAEIERAFEGANTKISNLGVLPAEEVSRVLSESDSMLYVRGLLYPGRGSALAGIACGLPLIGYAGACEGTPVAEAGVELVPYGDREALARALSCVLQDPTRWQELHERSLRAQRKYFSWDVIARNLIALLQGEGRKT